MALLTKLCYNDNETKGKTKTMGRGYVSMNIEALSKELGVSYKTVYRRIAGAGLVLDDLKGADGQLSYEGIQAISALFDKVGDNNRGKDNDNGKVETRLKALNSGIDSAKDKAIADARAEIERLKGAVSAAEIKAEAAEREKELYKQMAEKAEAEAARWRAQAEQAQSAASRAQEIQALQLQMLPQRAGGRGFLSRIFGRKEGNGE